MNNNSTIITSIFKGSASQKLVLGFLCSVFALVFAMATPVSAHRESSSHGADVGGVDGRHLSVYACDNEYDGHGVRTEYQTFAGHRDHVGDANGSAAGCGSELSIDGVEIYRFRVCEESKGCSNWNYTSD